MRKAQKKMWLKALRSGKYKQGKAHLHHKEKNTYCCLGVLCDKASNVEELKEGQRFISIHTVFNMKGSKPMYASSGFLPNAYRTWLGISREDQATLVGLNDSGASFDEIANWIEMHL